MRRWPAGVVVVLALLSPATAAARKPLGAKDMKTIRKDARAKGASFKLAYDAAAWSVRCRRRGPYSARCRIRLGHALSEAGKRHDCTITLVYVATRTRTIAGNLADDGCA